MEAEAANFTRREVGLMYNTDPHRGLFSEHPNAPCQWARREGGGEKVFPVPQRFRAPSSLKNTEKGIPNGFCLISNVHKIPFRPGGGSAPDPAEGDYVAFQTA